MCFAFVEEFNVSSKRRIRKSMCGHKARLQILQVLEMLHWPTSTSEQDVVLQKQRNAAVESLPGIIYSAL